MSVDVVAIRQFITESSQEYRAMLSKIDEIQLSIQSIRTSPAHSYSIASAHNSSNIKSNSSRSESVRLTSDFPASSPVKTAYYDINPIAGSVLFTTRNHSDLHPL